MSAGNLIILEQIMDAPCVHDWCRGPAAIYMVGRLRLRICQGCAAHGGVSDNDMRNLLGRDSSG